MEFENGRTEIHDVDRTGRLATSRINVNAACVEELILENRRVTQFEVADSTIMGKWKRLFANGCNCKSPIPTATEFLNSCHSGTCLSVLGDYFEKY